MKLFKIIFLIVFTFFVYFFNSAYSQNTNQANENPKEVYGNPKNKIALRISNGGAGPTGIIKYLADDYLSINKDKQFTIAWYQNISKFSVSILKKNKIDIALIYEPVDAKKAVREGLASNYTPIFNDHFLIVGPEKNQAGILSTDSPAKAFAKIHKYGEKSSKEKLFLSRNDLSGTNIKERLLWTIIHKSPFDDNTQWYFKFPKFPSDALLKADQEKMYTITDWGTWITNEDKIKNSKIYIKGGEDLVNPCIALLQKNPSKNALHFLEYLKSSRAQQLIANYGKEIKQKKAFFTPAEQIDFEN